MALEQGLKQRIVGAVVLLGLAVIFVPMLLSRQDDVREVRVEVPPMPKPALLPDMTPEPVQELPALTASQPEYAEQPVLDQLPEPGAEPQAQAEPTPAPMVESAKAEPPAVAAPLDSNGLPEGWSVQLASLSNKASAEQLVKDLRAKGYNGYYRTHEQMHRVFVGPVLDKGEASKLREQLQRQRGLNGFVVRFAP
jgi:DedD protein